MYMHHTEYLGRRMSDQFQAPLELAQLVMRRRSVDENLGAIQAHMDVRTVGREQLLANLNANRRIGQRQ